MVSRFLFLMKQLFNRKRFLLFLCIGLMYCIGWSLHHITKYEDAAGGWIVNEIWREVYLVIMFYVLFEITYRYMQFSVRNFIPYILILLVQFLITGVLLVLWRDVGIALGIYTDYSHYKTFKENWNHQATGVASSAFFFAIARHLYDYFQLKQATQKLRIEKQEAELNYLKSQTNPHFLFNTLNNIYALTKEKSDLAPESVLRLSKILRYMLYETATPYTALEKEIKIISDYIELEKLRYDESLRVNFNHSVEDMHQAVPPLLLIPLVENAFKHGVSETRHQPYIDIHLKTQKQVLQLVITNSTDEPANTASVKENIGLSNLRRQLELLYTSFELKVVKGDHVFTASLTINLASHV